MFKAFVGSIGCKLINRRGMHQGLLNAEMASTVQEVPESQTTGEMESILGSKNKCLLYFCITS